ncbi:zinc ABC transporter substrate-binding protein [Salinispirillum sp. LH 10-3-1]|uniref:High-affinity zinc uptake system protein ZnuA n=1 Tax=Salinispirillum sp. LH 10-3-1 TaxID=2952525 RepID=A0AB38YG71_9GAMM
MYAFRLFVCLLSAALLSSVALATPRVVVSIAPVHSWVSQVSGDLWQPELLLSAQQDPHNALLRPSQRSMVAEADWVIWLGPQLETGLVSLLRRVPAERQWRLTSEEVDLIHYEFRTSGTIFTQERHSSSMPDHLAQFMDHGHDHQHDDVDPHLWLHPENARRAIGYIARHLGTLDPANAGAYERNAAQAIAELIEHEARWSHQLNGVRKPYVVFHDGYQYFDRAFGLPFAGSVTLNPEQLPGLRTLNEMRSALADGAFGCLFAEAQYADRLVTTIAEGFSLPVGRLDALGISLEPGRQHYVQLLDQLVTEFTACDGAVVS